MKKSTLIILGIIVLSFVTGIYFYSRMPESMASHWGFDGSANGYMTKFWGLFLMPLICVFLFLLFQIFPRIDPLKENILKFRKYFDGFVIAVFLFLFYIYILTIFWNLGYEFNMSRFLAPALGMLFFCIGIMIKNSKRNWFIGIRTPWTLANDEIWDKTHKLGSKLFEVSGIVAIFGVIIPDYAFFLVLVPVIFSTIYTYVYSYFLFRKLNTTKIK